MHFTKHVDLLLCSLSYSRSTMCSQKPHECSSHHSVACISWSRRQTVLLIYRPHFNDSKGPAYSFPLLRKEHPQMIHRIKRPSSVSPHLALAPKIAHVLHRHVSISLCFDLLSIIFINLSGRQRSKPGKCTTQGNAHSTPPSFFWNPTCSMQIEFIGVHCC